MARARSFLKDCEGDFSSSRLAMLFGILVGGIVCLVMAWNGTLDGVIFGCFMAASGGIYGMGKYQDTKRQMKD